MRTLSTKIPSAPVALAKESLRYYFAHGRVLPVPSDVAPELKGRAGAFVSLKKHGRLRGCIGTFQPTQDSLAAEIIRNAISAGTQDPRFSPVQSDELAALDISVDILEAPERIDSLDQLDPQKYGVIVQRDHRSGLLLPMLDGVDTVQEQVSIAMQKAGIEKEEDIELYRFTVTRYQ